MALTEETVQDKIEIVGDYKHVQVRTATIIKRNGVEISRNFSRHVVAPDADITGQNEAGLSLVDSFLSAVVFSLFHGGLH